MSAVFDDAGGRVFFSNAGRSLEGEDEIRLISVGVDIGSSTSHLVFSRIVMERLDARYVVSEREVFYNSDILLTPYTDTNTINADALGAFIAHAYKDAMITPEEIDTGALILTGVAVVRSNARRIGDVFAREAGKLVAVSAGDSLETVLAAHGSGAVARSIRDGKPVMNVDVGGGTSKIAVCVDGRVAAATAIDVGARLICFANDGTITRVEAAARRFAAASGFKLELGTKLDEVAIQRLTKQMADCLFDAMRGGAPVVEGHSLLRTKPLGWHGEFGTLMFSGGVSEYIYDREATSFGDLGAALAREIRARVAQFGVPLAAPAEHIRATVIGAAQYATQVSGNTIFVSPPHTLPLRNIPVVTPAFSFADEIDADGIALAIADELDRLELSDAVALFVTWSGSATFARLDAFCRGVTGGLGRVLGQDKPIILAGDGDVGGLLGIHLREEIKVANPVVSIDGLELKEFDYIDIGAMLEGSGAVPVVIKSLVFPQVA
ncbi:MAG: ethanolamine ammonia-lyase reactivating factor EutA [Xanthobacteraceae bacterium]|nr:ethanolamine ammonia-lyase reactivating factor EutA [Xanthobacteraceae bacterium]